MSSEVVRSVAVAIQRVDGPGRKIRGLASVYYNGQPGAEYPLAENVVERIAPGAFDGLLAGDVVACVNHDVKTVVGRTPDTLKLWTDGSGLHYEIDLPNTTAANDLLENVQRGLIKGSSFKASIDFSDKTQATWTKDGPKDVLTIKRFGQLIDVSPCVQPAYTATDCQAVMRSLEQHNAMQETLKRVAYWKSLKWC